MAFALDCARLVLGDKVVANTTNIMQDSLKFIEVLRNCGLQACCALRSAQAFDWQPARTSPGCVANLAYPFLVPFLKNVAVSDGGTLLRRGRGAEISQTGTLSSSCRFRLATPSYELSCFVRFVSVLSVIFILTEDALSPDVLIDLGSELH